MSNHQNKLITTVIVLLALPPFLYTFALLLSDLIRIFGKADWASRPFIYIQIENIFTYLIYTFSSLIFILEISRKNKNNITKAGLTAICLSLLFFWLGLLLNVIGITSQH